jgi:hypothetical protein
MSTYFEVNHFIFNFFLDTIYFIIIRSDTIGLLEFSRSVARANRKERVYVRENQTLVGEKTAA